MRYRNNRGCDDNFIVEEKRHSVEIGWRFFDSVELKKHMEKKQMLWYDGYAVETFQQKGGETMDYILRFLVSVMASVAGYYIRKWLDRNDKDS